MIFPFVPLDFPRIVAYLIGGLDLTKSEYIALVNLLIVISCGLAALAVRYQIRKHSVKYATYFILTAEAVDRGFVATLRLRYGDPTLYPVFDSITAVIRTFFLIAIILLAVSIVLWKDPDRAHPDRVHPDRAAPRKEEPETEPRKTDERGR